MLGFGVLVGDADAANLESTTNPKLVLDGEFKQYNWVSKEEKNNVTDTYAEYAMDAALNKSEYEHNIGGTTFANMGVVFLNTKDTSIENSTGLPYALNGISILTVSGQVYSLTGATENQIFSNVETADRTTLNGLYQPQFRFDANLGGQYIEKTDDGDEFLYVDNDVIKVLFPSGDSKEIDLAALVNITKYSGQALNLTISLKNEAGNTVELNNNKATLSAAGLYTITYTVTDELFYD
jgi:hypothetical protein